MELLRYNDLFSVYHICLIRAFFWIQAVIGPGCSSSVRPLASLCLAETLALIRHVSVIRLNTAFTLHSAHSSCSARVQRKNVLCAQMYTHGQSTSNRLLCCVEQLGQTPLDPLRLIEELCYEFRDKPLISHRMCFLLRSYRPPAFVAFRLRKRKNFRSNWLTEDEVVWNNIPRRCWLWVERGGGCNTSNRWEDQPLTLP